MGPIEICGMREKVFIGCTRSRPKIEARWRRRKRTERKEFVKEEGIDLTEKLGCDVIQDHVLNRLDGCSLLRCSMASRQWRSVAVADNLWYPLCQKLWSGLAHLPMRLTRGSSFSFYSDSYALSQEYTNEDAKKYEFPTLANWNKNKDVTVTVYVEKPRAPDKGKGLDGTKEHAAGSASRSGPLAPKGNKVGAQVDTVSKQLRYSKRHGSDRRAEILRWYQEVNQRSRNQSVGSDSLTDSAMNPTSVNENTHAIMRPKNYEQNLSKNHEVILEKLEARLRKAVPSYPKLRDIYLKSTNTKPQGDYSALVRKQSLKAAKMELSLAGTRKVEPSNIKTRPREKALPKFGQWDLKNLGAETEYTAIFNEARAEKKDRKSVMHSYSQRSPSYRQPILLKQKNRKKWRSFVSKLSAFRSICQ